MKSGERTMKKDTYNVLLVGSTGSGKSSTINAILDKDLARVGVSADPETMHISSYKYKNFTFWDTPGFGDDVNKDLEYAKKISDKLNETDQYGNFLIDQILVILDAGSRDLGTPYQLLNTVVLPSLKQNNSHQKIVFAVNQADRALKNGKGWDYDKNIPTPEGKKYLQEQLRSIKKRIHETAGIKIDDSIYFASGYTENGKRHKGFRIDELINFINKNIPKNNINIQNGAVSAGVLSAAALSYGYNSGYCDNFNDDDFSLVDDGFEMIDNTLNSVEEFTEDVLDFAGEVFEDITDTFSDFFDSFF
jgi:predicted GTPase